MRKRLLLSLFLLLSYQLLSAQNSGPTETKTIYLEIRSTERFKDTILCVLRSAEGLGLQHKQLVKAYQSYIGAVAGKNERRDFREVAAGKIIILDSINAPSLKLQEPLYTGLVIFYNTADTLTRGDMISVTVDIPVLPYRSIFSKLAFNDVILTNADREPLYNLQAIINRDDRQVEDSIYNVITTDLHATYERVKNRTDIPPVLLEKIKAGRFKDRIPLDIIRDVTRKEIEAFLLYCDTYPAGYMAKNNRASESFAGWIISNSPYCYPEVKNALLPVYRNRAAFLKLLPTYQHDIISEGMPKSLGIEAIALSESLHHEEANELADFAIVMADAVNDTEGQPYTHLCKAQVLLKQARYAETIIECDKATIAAQQANDKDAELQSIIKKAYCLFKISKYRDAQLVLSAVEKKLSEYKPSISESIYMTNRQKVYEYKGYILYESGEYKNALITLDTAIQINNLVNSYDAKIRNAEYFTFMGRVNNEKGDAGEALKALEKAAEIYKNNSDALNRAIVENEISNSYFNLGEYRRSIQFADSALKRSLVAGDYNNAGYSNTLKGSCYWELGQYDSAVMVHKEAIAFRKKSDNLSGQAFSWKRIGQLYLLSGQKTQALPAFDSAVQLYRLVKDSAGMADVYNKKGEVYLNDESFKKAADLFEKAKGINSKATVEALYKLGSAWEAIDTTRAAKYYEESRELSKSTDNTNYQFYATMSLASLAYKSHDAITGDHWYKECLLLGKQLNTDEATANCLVLNAYRFYNNTQLDSALYYYWKAKMIFDTADKSQSIWQLNNIAQTYLSTGEFQKADEAILMAIAMARATKNTLALGSVLQTSSFLYGLTAEFEKGVRNNDTAIAIFKNSGNMVRLANTYTSRGTLLKSMGEYDQSVKAYLFADSIFKDESLNESRGIVFNNIGLTYMDQADYPNTMRYFRQAEALLKPGVVDESYLLVQGNIAECLYRSNKLKEAEALFLDILPKAKKLGLNRIASGMALILGTVFQEENKLTEANAYLGYARDLAQSSGEKDKLIESLTMLGKINQQQHNGDSALQNLRTAASLVKQFKTANSWGTFYELGLLFYDQRKFDSSIFYFKQAVEMLDKNAANLYGGEEAKKIFNNDPRKSDLYNKITFAYFNMGSINDAWTYANRSNIAGIKELSGSLSVNSGDADKNEALRKVLAMQESKKALENTLVKQEGQEKKETLKKIEILEADYNNFLQDVVTQYPELSPYFKGYNADEFNNYKDQLKDDMAVALYLLNGNTLMIFTLTNEKLAVDTMHVDIVPRINNFIQAVKNTEKQTGTGALSLRSDPQDEDKNTGAVEFKDISDELYNILITTVYDKIGSKKKLCIIPTGVFSNMPFQCLGKKMPGNNFRFLIEDKAVFYTNKMSVFNNSKKRDTSSVSVQSFAAFGVPDASLHYNISEVQNIGKILGSDSTVYADGRATESMAKKSLKNKKIIHFATHGVLNYSSDFSLSYLKLLPDKDTSNGNNGQLTMREIQRLGITDCNMVILSACQTAVSKQVATGWNISPANSFLISNVRTVVASLWKVADEPTELLMEYFYENLEKNIDKVEALRQAQVRLSQDVRFRHPNYWGAFVLYGDWR